jgi:hypothetical protein
LAACVLLLLLVQLQLGLLMGSLLCCLLWLAVLL